MSPAEIALWQRLRDKPEGLRFRRQHPFGLFSLDFYCPAGKLVIEVDGAAHGMGDNPERDQERDRRLAACGMETVRVPAGDVLRDADAVADALVRMVLGRRRPPVRD